jgi:ATF/CREB family transcription factor
MYSQENDSLNAQIAQMRDETVNLKTILLAHKECNVTRAQGLHGIPLQQVLDGGVQIPNYGQMNPYGMAMSNHQAITGQDMQRRYS